MLSSNKDQIVQKEETLAPKQPWESMKLDYVGHIGEVLQGGGGKLSMVFPDGTDPNKQRGQETP